MITNILFFVPNACPVYPDMCKHVKCVIVNHFGHKHAESDETHSFVTITGCEVTEKDLDTIFSKINKGIKLLCIKNLESSQLSERFTTLNVENK